MNTADCPPSRFNSAACLVESSVHRLGKAVCLAPHDCTREIRFIDDFPNPASGKFQRLALREQAAR